MSYFSEDHLTDEQLADFFCDSLKSAFGAEPPHVDGVPISQVKIVSYFENNLNSPLIDQPSIIKKIFAVQFPDAGHQKN